MKIYGLLNQNLRMLIRSELYENYYNSDTI